MLCMMVILKNAPRWSIWSSIIMMAVIRRGNIQMGNTKDGKGIQIPKDIQIIGFDDNLASRESNPALTTIHQEAPLRAKTAIKCLEAMRDGAECETEIVLPVKLIKRESTGELSCQSL